jgi:hypothetical protein
VFRSWGRVLMNRLMLSHGRTFSLSQDWIRLPPPPEQVVTKQGCPLRFVPSAHTSLHFCFSAMHGEAWSLPPEGKNAPAPCPWTFSLQNYKPNKNFPISGIVL